MLTGRAYRIFIIIFGSLTGLFFILWYFIPIRTVDARVLLACNLLLFLIGVWSYRTNMMALRHEKLHYFLRKVYGSLFLKLILFGGVALAYIATQKKEVNKPALFGCFALYFIYTFTEVRLVMKKPVKPDA